MLSPKDGETLEQFEQYRPMMFSIAHRMLGSMSEAKDMLQTAYLRIASCLLVRSLHSKLSSVRW